MFGGRNNKDEDVEDAEKPDEGTEQAGNGSDGDGMNLPGLGSVKGKRSGKNTDPAELLKGKDLDSANEMQEILKENPEIIDQYNMTWSVQKVQGFLPNINPSYIRARTEKAKTEAMAEANNNQILTGDRVMILGIFLIIGAIAYVIIQQGAGGSGGGGGPAQDVASGAGASISLLGASLRQKYYQWRTE